MTTKATIRRTVMPLLAVALLVGAAMPASADTVYSTFGPMDSYDTAQAGVVGTPGVGFSVEHAAVFSPSFDATLDSIRFPARYFSGPNDFTLYIAPDNGGSPGAALETFTGLVFTDLPGGSILTLNSTLNPLLSSGSTYWWS